MQINYRDGTIKKEEFENIRDMIIVVENELLTNPDIKKITMWPRLRIPGKRKR